MFRKLGYERIYFKKPVVGSRWKKKDGELEYSIQVFPNKSCNKFINACVAHSMDSFRPEEIRAVAKLLDEMGVK